MLRGVWRQRVPAENDEAFGSNGTRIAGMSQQVLQRCAVLRGVWWQRLPAGQQQDTNKDKNSRSFASFMEVLQCCTVLRGVWRQPVPAETQKACGSTGARAAGMSRDVLQRCAVLRGVWWQRVPAGQQQDTNKDTNSCSFATSRMCCSAAPCSGVSGGSGFLQRCRKHVAAGDTGSRHDSRGA
jgi:hypothetical protein